MAESWGGGNRGATSSEWDAERMGEDVRSPELRRVWEMAVRLAGGLPYIWSELARPISEIVYGLLELRAGDRVLLIGEGVGSAGWAEDMRALVGPDGVVDVREIIRDGREAVHNRRVGRNGQIGCWRWDYADGLASESYDVVAVHGRQRSMRTTGQRLRANLLRVMKPGTQDRAR